MPEDELAEHRFFPPDEFDGALPARLVRRVRSALIHRELGVPADFENGYAHGTARREASPDIDFPD